MRKRKRTPAARKPLKGGGGARPGAAPRPGPGPREKEDGHLRPASAAAPDDVEALNALGRAARARGDLARAVASFRRALEIDPDNALVHNNLANAYLSAGRIADAERHYREAIRADPNLALAHSNLGHLLSLQERDMEGAVSCFRRALEMDPRQADIWHRLGTTLRRLGNPREAVAALSESLRIEGDNVAAHYHLGLAKRDLGRLDEALESFRRALALAPSEPFTLAAVASLEAAARAGRVLGPGAKRVALHMNQSFHYAFLRPLFDALSERHHALITGEARDVADFDPDVVIVADAQSGALRTKAPRANYVLTRHGLISKKLAYASAALADYVCVSSETVRDWYVENGGVPRKGFWITGYVQMDPLFRDEPLALPFTLPKDRKTVLYAPTFNPRLSSAPMVRDRIVALIRGRRRDLSVIIKPHPHICAHQPAWMAWWRPAARAEPHVHLVKDPAADLVPYLKAADVLVSDASSAPFLFLALDRPIVLVTNPRAAEDKDRYDPDGIEWRWRDVGEEVRDIAELPAAVDRALAEPARHAERRAHYRRLLFGTLTDGRAVERIEEHVTALEV